MTRRRTALPILLFAVAWAAGHDLLSAGRISARVDIGIFHNALAPYGDWVETPRFGLVWTPAEVGHGWRPYMRGHWIFTDFGWTWVGDDDWCWATDHYGRWAFDPDYGWIWVPGSRWGPAWVAWRYGGGYVGWAPLPPGVGIDRTGVNFDAILDPFAFTFVEEPFLIAVNLRPHIIPVARNVTYVRVTNNITNYTIVENRVVNRGVEIGRIEKALGRPVPRLQVRDAESVETSSRGRVRGTEAAFYRPKVGTAPADKRPPGAARGVRTVAPPSQSEATAPGPAPAQESGDTAARRQRREANRLQATEERERQALRDVQQAEEQTAPAGPPLVKLRERHDAEMKAQARHEQRERQMLEARQRRQQGAEKPPPPKRKP